MGANHETGRRDLLTAAAGAAVLTLAAAIPGGAAMADGTVTVASWGGSYQKAQNLALFEPAAKALGITVKEETHGGMSDVRLKVNAGAVAWDIVSSGSGSAARAAAEGCWRSSTTPSSMCRPSTRR